MVPGAVVIVGDGGSMIERTDKLARRTVFTITELTERWGVSETSVRRLVADGTLQAAKLKGPTRILRTSVEQQEDGTFSPEEIKSVRAELAPEILQPAQLLPLATVGPMSDRTNKLTRPTVFTVREVMERWGLSDRSVRRLVADGILQTIKGNGPMRILRTSVEEQEDGTFSPKDTESVRAELAPEIPQQDSRLGVVPTVIALIQPRMLSRKRAAAYCGVSVTRFRDWCPVMPVRVTPRVILYDRAQIDQWLDSLSGTYQ